MKKKNLIEEFNGKNLTFDKPTKNETTSFKQIAVLHISIRYNIKGRYELLLKRKCTLPSTFYYLKWLAPTSCFLFPHTLAALTDGRKIWRQAHGNDNSNCTAQWYRSSAKVQGINSSIPISSYMLSL